MNIDSVWDKIIQQKKIVNWHCKLQKWNLEEDSTEVNCCRFTTRVCDSKTRHVMEEQTSTAIYGTVDKNKEFHGDDVEAPEIAADNDELAGGDDFSSISESHEASPKSVSDVLRETNNEFLSNPSNLSINQSPLETFFDFPPKHRRWHPLATTCGAFFVRG